MNTTAAATKLPKVDAGFLADVAEMLLSVERLVCELEADRDRLFKIAKKLARRLEAERQASASRSLCRTCQYREQP